MGDHRISHLEEILKENDLFSFDVATEACLSIASIITCARAGYNGMVNGVPVVQTRSQGVQYIRAQLRYDFAAGAVIERKIEVVTPQEASCAEDRGMERLLANKFTMGGDASAAVGPVGHETSAMTDATMRAEMLSWSRSRGVFAGVSLDGATLRPDEDVNKGLYGAGANPKTIPRYMVGLDYVDIKPSR